MQKFRSLALFVPLLAAPLFAGNITFVSTPGPLVDTIDWAGLGADPTLFADGATVNSALGNITTIGLQTQPDLGGVISVVCAELDPANCSWPNQPSGYTDGESLLWAEGTDTNNNRVGTGPVSLSFANGVNGVGAFLQSESAGEFTAFLSLYNGNTLLGTSQSFSSDLAGDPVYLGALDDTAGDITKAVFSVTACGGFVCDANDFSLGTVEIYGTPEPSTFLLGGLALGFLARIRFGKGKK
jgi:hypothetical protein